jgi:hypothetical protein
MEDKDSVQTAKEEMEVIAPSGDGEAVPQSIEEVIAGLKGFGIEELEEILTLRSKGKTVRLKISNIPTSDEMLSIQASDEFKGYLWVKRVKAEILSRAISWIDGIDIRKLPPEKRFVADPTDPQKSVRDLQVVFRNLILSWGQEVMELLWKVVMTHAQNIEDRLRKEFPDSTVMTEIEKRLFENAAQQIEAASQAIIDESVAELYDSVTMKPEAETK